MPIWTLATLHRLACVTASSDAAQCSLTVAVMSDFALQGVRHIDRVRMFEVPVRISPAHQISIRLKMTMIMDCGAVGRGGRSKGERSANPRLGRTTRRLVTSIDFMSQDASERMVKRSLSRSSVGIFIVLPALWHRENVSAK